MGDRNRRASVSSFSRISDEDDRMEVGERTVLTRKRKNEVEKRGDAKMVQEDVSEEPVVKRSGSKESKKALQTTVNATRKDISPKEIQEGVETSEEETEDERFHMEEAGKKEECEDIARKIMEETSKILEAVAREHNGKISVTRKEQSEVRGSVAAILMQVTEMMARQMQLERELNETKGELELLKKKRGDEKRRGRRSDRERQRSQRGESSTEESVSSARDLQEIRNRRRQRTYAEVSKNESKNGECEDRMRIEGRVIVPGREGWKTPPPVSRGGENTLILTSKEGKGAKELAKIVAKNLPVKEIGGAPPVVRETRDGRLVVVPKDKNQQAKLTEKIEKIQGIEVRETRRAEPLLVISGVEIGLTEGELTEQIYRGLGDNVEGGLDGIKIVKRFQCKNPWKENIVVRMGLNEFKHVVKRGKIEIGCMLYFAEEYLDLAMCFSCRFGHVMKYCKEKQVCADCGDEHDRLDCREERLRCINCFRMYRKVLTHSARDFNCPAMKDALVKSRKNITYGS